MKVRMGFYSLKGKANIWWKYLKISHWLKEDLEWLEFKKLFKKQYLSKIYYERKTKEFYELKLGQMTTEDLINKFLDLLRFVSYIKCVKVKMQWFLCFLPQYYKDEIEFDYPNNLDKFLRKTTLCF